MYCRHCKQCAKPDIKNSWKRVLRKEGLAINFVTLSVNWRHIRLIDLVSAKGKTKVSWLISFYSLIRQCFNILIWHWHCINPSRIRNIKIERSKQLYYNNTLPLFSTLPKLKSVDSCPYSSMGSTVRRSK